MVGVGRYAEAPSFSETSILGGEEADGVVACRSGMPSSGPRCSLSAAIYARSFKGMVQAFTAGENEEQVLRLRQTPD